MTDQIKVFWIEPNGRERRWLRRFSMRPCAGKGYCDASYLLGDTSKAALWDEVADADPRWPTHCEGCQQAFAAKDDHQKFSRHLYVRPDTGETMTLLDAPPGACWNASWYVEGHDRKPGSEQNTGPDGRCLIVRLPDGHDWMIDSRCSNCTRPDDNDHFCWVRHGKPEDGTLTVDKNGNTCSAGAGSILTPKWHGFLHGGYLHT